LFGDNFATKNQNNWQEIFFFVLTKSLAISYNY
jgi:hypothetical protein